MKTFLFVLLILVFLLSIVVFVVQPPKPPKSVSSVAELEIYLTRLTMSDVPPGLSAMKSRMPTPSA
jgi:hypothetical protein